MNIKVAVCDHFLNEFGRELDSVSIEYSNNFDCVCFNTLTHLISIFNQCPGKICSCTNEENQKHFCVTCM